VHNDQSPSPSLLERYALPSCLRFYWHLVAWARPTQRTGVPEKCANERTKLLLEALPIAAPIVDLASHTLQL
jgi:hypothetical protein